MQGGLTVRNGPGGSTVWGDETTDLHVGGVFSVVDGAGTDKVELWGVAAVAAGGLALDNGADRDGSYVQVHPYGDLTVAGGVRMTNGARWGLNRARRPERDHRRGGRDSERRRRDLQLRGRPRGPVGRAGCRSPTAAGQDYNEVVSYDTAVLGGVSYANGAGGSTNYIGDDGLLIVGGNVSVVSGSGRDVNTIFGGDARVGGAITVRNSDGDSDTTVGGAYRLSVGGPTRITSGVGGDTVSLGTGGVAGTSPAVHLGPVRVSNGDGGSNTQVRGGRLAVHGSVGITAGAGVDTAIVATEADSGLIAGGVTIAVGAGDTQFVSVGAATGQSLTIGGPLGIRTDNPVGFNSVDLTGVEVLGGTTIVTGAGADEVRVAGSTFGGSFALDTGAGDDTVWLEWNGGATSFWGPVRVNAGDGNDRVWVLGGGTGGQAVFAGSSTWDGGAGTDVINVRPPGTLYVGPQPVVSGFETGS